MPPRQPVPARGNGPPPVPVPGPGCTTARNRRWALGKEETTWRSGQEAGPKGSRELTPSIPRTQPRLLGGGARPPRAHRGPASPRGCGAAVFVLPAKILVGATTVMASALVTASARQ